MLTYNRKIEWMVALFLGLVIGSVICNPMYYKKTDDDTYEPDLVAVSSTVIPVYSYHVNSTGAVKYHAMDEDEYRLAYMRLMTHKKRKPSADDPDTLITLTKKYNPEKTTNEHEATVNSA
ncbi:uncharacterized protein LOC129570006 [Sitodiplosis mosellana]|uniref:uncharacterized protein LOC129570006 n=1 Tax=Sitodiplosis mosellana TaxID=263140 RepID=UPI0024442132|nr:uncharacterized protein LOC129570006 [Sitodiplosis mosellana]